jgi:hypothetical protein
MRRSPVLAILAIVIAVLAIALGFTNGRSSGPTADLVDYAVSADGKQLVVTAIVPRQCDIDRSVGAESSTAVQVTVTLSCSGSPIAGDAPLVDVPIALASPLNGRAVFDANGAAVSPKTP